MEQIQKKKDQKETKVEIINHRVNHLQFGEQGKDGAYDATWKGIKIAKYTGLKPPYPFIEKIKQNLVNWDQANFVATRDAPLKKFNLYECVTLWCGCGINDMEKDIFLNHIKDAHKEIILAKSQLNRPHWQDLIVFNDDMLEEEFCYNDYDLNDFK